MTEQNNYRKLFSVVALVFFAPIISTLLKDNENDYELSENDIKIINTYKKAWYLVLLSTIINISILIVYIKYSLSFLIYIIYWITAFITIYLLYNINLIYSDKWALFFSWNEIKKIEVNNVKAWNIDYLLLYLPFVNEYLFQSKKFTKEQEYWLKESVFLYFILAIIWNLSIFFPNLVGVFFFLVFIIIARIVSLFFWIDVVADNIKANIYDSFEKRSLELFAYFCAWIKFILHNLFLVLTWKKTNEYWYYLYKTKELLKKEYELNSVLKKSKKYVSIILSYLIVTILFGYLFYKAYYSFRPYLYIFSVAILATYVYLISYLTKNLYNIPVISWILTKIIKKFN